MTDDRKLTDEQLHALMLDLHGDAGQAMYDAAIAKRGKAERRQALLQEIDQAKALMSPIIAEARARLAAVESSNAACFQSNYAAVEQAKLELHQARATLRDTIQAINDELRALSRPAAPFASAWSQVNWQQQNAEVDNPGPPGIFPAHEVAAAYRNRRGGS